MSPVGVTSLTATPGGSCTGTLTVGAIFPLAIDRSVPPGTCPYEALTNEIGAQETDGCSRRIGLVWEGYAVRAVARRARFVSLRFTSRALRYGNVFAP
jgi:hypothetical protein